VTFWTLTVDRRHWPALKRFLAGRGDAWIAYRVPGNNFAPDSMLVIGTGEPTWRGATRLVRPDAVRLARIFAAHRRPDEIEASPGWSLASAA
jgi:hypothetical protein